VVATPALSAEELAAPERVRPDLASRIAGYRCNLLPLDQRLGDLGTLLADLCAELGVAECKLDPSAVGPLLRHGWPGNVRELRQTLEVATALAGGAPIGVKHLPQLRGSRTSPAGASALVEI
jgi:sigma-54 dependent transcriptional regulator, acetoin dehydrogenase operon transcriptional activator AcoR